MAESHAEKMIKEQARKRRSGELFAPAAALFAYVLYWLNDHGWPLAAQREQALGIAALAAAIFWFGAMRAAMSAIAAFLLAPVWILLIGEKGIGWIGLLAVVSLAGWKEEGQELPWKATLLALGSWLLTGMLAGDVAILTGMPATEEGVRQLALLGGVTVWAAMIAAALPVWAAATILGAAYCWRAPGPSALAAWAALMGASLVWAAIRKRPGAKPAADLAGNSGARFANPEEMEAYRYE